MNLDVTPLEALTIIDALAHSRTCASAKANHADAECIGSLLSRLRAMFTRASNTPALPRHLARSA